MRSIAIIAAAAMQILTCAAHAQTPSFKIIHTFGALNISGDGSNPNGPLVLDAVGNLYGVTSVGGTVQCGTDYGCGTVFELSQQSNGSWRETILHSFAAGSDGAFPWGNLAVDSAGDVYGTAEGHLSFAATGVFGLMPSGGG